MNLESALTKTREIIRLRHLALATEDSYVSWIARYSRFISERNREPMLKPKGSRIALLS